MLSTEAAAALYDATIAPVWRLAVCLHGATPAAEDAVARAYAAYADLPASEQLLGAAATTRLLALVQRADGPQTGIRTRAVVPRPRRLTRLTSPPWASTTARTMLRPRPTPWTASRREPSAR